MTRDEVLKWVGKSSVGFAVAVLIMILIGGILGVGVGLGAWLVVDTLFRVLGKPNTTPSSRR